MTEDPQDSLQSVDRAGRAALSEAYQQIGLDWAGKGRFSGIETEFEVTGQVIFKTSIREIASFAEGSVPRMIIEARSEADIPELTSHWTQGMGSSMRADFLKDPTAVFPTGYRDERDSEQIIRIEEDCGPCHGKGDESCGSCNGHGALICGRCNGHVQLHCGRCSGRGTELCLNCNGNARLWNGSEWVNCRRCFGTGWGSGCWPHRKVCA